MPRFPYMNMPFSYYRNYPRYPNPYDYSSYYAQSTNNKYHNNGSFSNNNNNNNNMNMNNNSSDNWSKHKNENENKNKSNSNDNNYLFDLFGIKLYFDDILILSLLYFLYNEGVKDEMLFMSLLLLLIS